LTVAGAVSAQAADLPTRKAPPAPIFVPPPFTWTGFYIGGNAGGLWNTGNTQINAFFPASGLIFSNSLPGRLNTSESGFIGGGQVGYNWQTGAFVLGAEADFQGTSLSRNISVVGPSFVNPFTGNPTDNFTANAHQSLDWLGTVRGRVGFVATPDNRLMIYGTGGFAYGGGSFHANFCDFNANFCWGGSSNPTRVGWTIGGGLEYALTNNWIIGAEYLYYNLGSHSTTLLATGALDSVFVPGAFVNVKQEYEGSIVRGRISYKF
jgi:outer membrane immunogenic protein